MKSERKCVICGDALPARRSKYCGDKCAALADRLRGRKGHEPPVPYWDIVCPGCGRKVNVPIKSYRCPDCQRAADQRHDADHNARKMLGKTRLLGSTDMCCVCGAQYTVMSGRQKYCQDCRQQATKAAINKHKRIYMQDARSDPDRRDAINQGKRRRSQDKICRQCGKAFSGFGSSEYCSTKCRTSARREYYAEYDRRRAESQREKSKHRNKSLTAEERAEVNRKARENYAKRKERKEGKHDTIQ